MFEHPRLVERLEVLYLSRTLGHFEDDPDGGAEFRWEQVAHVLAGKTFAVR